MPSPLPRDPRPTAGVLLVGPGPRAQDLARVLDALGTPQGVAVRAFTDPADLVRAECGGGLLLLDVDATPLEDVGYVRRFLAAHPELGLVLLGSDPRSRTARVFGARSFAHWPPDVEDLAAFVAAARTADAPAGAPPARSAAPESAAARAAPRPGAPAPANAAEESELEQVRAILESETDPRANGRTALASSAAPVPAHAGEPEPSDLPVDDDEPADGGSPAVEAIDEADAEPEPRLHGAVEAPPWWRAQVADLADSAQRIDLSVKMLAEAAPEIDEGDLDEARTRLRELEGEVARLLQFTRTLGYVAAPPPVGSQTFDLGEMVHHFASGLAQSGPDAPRCQYKTVPGAVVRSDRQLLSQALDAVFFLARCTSRRGDLVRAQVMLTDQEGSARTELVLDFPSGPLEGLPEADILEPYGLTDLFPELGPNALAAASGIVAGQGGTLALSNRGRGRLTWRLALPRAVG